MRLNLRLSAVMSVAVIVAVIALAVVPQSAASPAGPTRVVTVSPPTTHGVKPRVEKSSLERFYEALYWQAVKRYVDHLLYIQWMRHAVAYEKAKAAAAAAHAAAVAGHHGTYVDGIEVCNGTSLPTCGIVARESGFNPRAENPVSSASGLYQFIDGTWGTCRTGYGHASYAPVAVQVACARLIWDNGRGSGHWRLTR